MNSQFFGLCVPQGRCPWNPNLYGSGTRFPPIDHSMSGYAYANEDGDIVPRYSPDARIILSPGEARKVTTFVNKPSMRYLTPGERHASRKTVLFAHPDSRPNLKSP